MEPSTANFRFYAFTRRRLGSSAVAICGELRDVWGDASPSERTIQRWCHEFDEEGRVSFEDLPRTGRPRTTRNCEMVERVSQLIHDDPKLSSRDIAEALDTDHMSILRILKEDLKLRNVCAVWVPHELTPDNKQLRVNCAKHIRRSLIHADWHSLYAVEDETFIPFDPLLPKSENRTWIPKDEPRHQVVRPTLTTRKCLLLVAFTPNKRFSVEALPYGQTVTAERMIDFIQHTGEKWRGLRAHPVHLNQLMWQMDNARPHTAAAVREFLERRQVVSIWQSPYSPDMNLCDRFLFSWIKSELRKQTFHSHTEVEYAALHAMRALSEDALMAEVEKLLDHCQLVIEAGGDYITD